MHSLRNGHLLNSILYLGLTLVLSNKITISGVWRYHEMDSQLWQRYYFVSIFLEMPKYLPNKTTSLLSICFFSTSLLHQTFLIWHLILQKVSYPPKVNTFMKNIIFLNSRYNLRRMNCCSTLQCTLLKIVHCGN